MVQPNNQVDQNYNQNYNDQQYYDQSQQNQGYDQNDQQYYDQNQQQQYYDQNQQYYNDPNQPQQQYDPNQQQQMPYAGAQATPDVNVAPGMGTPNQMPTAAQIIQQAQYEAGNDGEIEMHVGEPVVVKSGLTEHHTYPIMGRDSIGDIEVSRRFQNFYDFRTMLLNRFPGLYIPPVPKKTTTTKKDESTVRERRYFLDLFLKECASLKYLAQSKELQTFLRPQGDLNQLMQKMYKPKLVDTLTTYRATMNIAEDFGERDIAVFTEEITRFATEQKNLNVHLQTFRATLKNIVPIKEQERQYYHQFSNFLERYEEGRGQGSQEVGALAHVRLITGDRNAALKDKLEVMTKQHSNPFVHINHWVKGEVWCLEALNECIGQKDAVDKRKKKCQDDINGLTDDINKLNANKFTFGSMFKSESGKKESAMEKETLRTELNKDVLLYDVLKKYLTIYLATVAIPAYKKQRIESYVRAMGRMADAEVRNSENTYDCWNNFQKTIISYNIKY